MSQAIKFFDGLAKEIAEGTRVCMLCKIDSFDATTMQADVTPLYKQKFKDGTEEPFPMILSIPVAHLKAGPFIIRPPYKRGDIVVVAFSDYATDETLLTGTPQAPMSNRKHSLDDAIVIGGILPYTTQYPAEHANDLLISKDNLSAKIVITEGNEIIIKTSGDVNVQASGNVNVKGSTINLSGNVNIQSSGNVSLKGSTINLN